MPKSLLEQLPEIVANGRKEAERILEGLESRQRVSLQTREWVLPARDSVAADWITTSERQQQRAQHDGSAWANRLIYGDNLLAMAALLAGDEFTPSLPSMEPEQHLMALPLIEALIFSRYQLDPCVSGLACGYHVGASP